MNNSKRSVDFCLLIPCYNNIGGLLASLKTVYYKPNQFLTVIVDDGSSKSLTEGDIAEKTTEGFPFVLLRNERNLGITAALNKGLDWISEEVNTKYIARLDCGDLCHTERFSLQVNYMEEHPETGLLGSWCRFEEKDGSGGYSYKTPVEHKDIARAMYSRNVFIHPTVMFRTDLLKKTGLYPSKYKYVEDYALFWKMIKCEQSSILDKFLVTCEINPAGLSMKNKKKQLSGRWKVVRDFGTDRFLKLLAFLRLKILTVMPKGLALQLKKRRK